MAFIHSPKIVTDGLVLALDAANTKSYPGSGTDWMNLSDVSITGSLISGSTFNGNNGGRIVFDGTNDYVNVLYPSGITNSPSFTIECVVKADAPRTSLATYHRFISWTSGSNNIQLGLGGTTGSVAGSERMFYVSRGASNIAPNFGIINIPAGNIYHVVATFDGTTTYQMYLNGVSQTNIQSTTAVAHSVNANTFFIGQRGDNAGYLSGSIYSIKLYNRVLSPQEVLQNFNATRGRFGV